eukprot:scaffold25778_cov129-Isochrysis_galbana.AAC.4
MADGSPGVCVAASPCSEARTSQVMMAAESCECDDGNENSSDHDRSRTRLSIHAGRPRSVSHLTQPLAISESGTSQMPAKHLCWSKHQYRQAKSGRMASPLTERPSIWAGKLKTASRCMGSVPCCTSQRFSASHGCIYVCSCPGGPEGVTPPVNS